ncbi:MAG: hypothetical protein JNJ57_11650, partial [Saprospiraceae bacterium]|nr:hypothetical protein [Saprospiraceae bacterium]
MSHLLRFFTILILVLVFTQNLFAQCLVVQSVVTPVSCHDGANGAIDVTVTGGVGNYSFIWSNDAFSEDVTDLSPGSYHLTVTDESGCFEFVSFDLGNPPVLQGNITAKCNFNGNSYDFELTCNVQGGASPYAYNWAPFSGQNATQITPGTITTYQVTITDHAGCTTVSEKFTGKPSIDNDLPEIPIDCTNPEVVLDASQCQYLPGQTIFKWFHANQTSLFITGPTDSLVTTVNAPGLFIFNVSDTITGCSAGKWFDVVSVQGPNAFFFADAGSDVTLSCINPSVQIGGNTTPTGPNYTYAWSTTDGHITSSSNTLYATVDQGGVYTLLVTNMVSGCTSTDQVTVSTQTLPIANAGPDLGLPCGGGVVTLAPVTSGQNIAVFWIGAAINASNQFLLNPLVNQAGVYTLIVTNTVTGCTATDQMTVFPGPLIASQQFSVTHVSCQSVSPGAIDLTVNFGTAPHTYLWSNGALTEDISNLTAGIYTVSVTDATGCTYTGKVTILQNGPAFTLDVIQSDPTCSGGSDGTINLSVVGSQPPYTFNWTGPNSFSSNLEDLSGLTAGNYQITVTDQGLCTQVASITLSNPAGALSLTATATPAFCGNNGAVDLTPQGAFTPFTYDWDIDGAEDPDNDTEDISDLPVGFYTVTVTDANGCTAVSGPHAVSAPSPLQISADVEPDPCSTGTDGAVDVSVSGGSGGYAFLWSTAATTEDLSQVAAGIYGLTVTDANGCSITASYSVLHESTIPNGSFTVQNASCEAGVNDGAITLNQVPTDAQAPLQFLWQGPAGFSSNNQNI